MVARAQVHRRVEERVVRCVADVLGAARRGDQAGDALGDGDAHACGVLGDDDDELLRGAGVTEAKRTARPRALAAAGPVATQAHLFVMVDEEDGNAVRSQEVVRHGDDALDDLCHLDLVRDGLDHLDEAVRAPLGR